MMNTTEISDYNPTMEYGSGVGIAQKLALEKRLLEEEKYIVQTLKKIKQERNGLQIERMHLISLLQQVLEKGKPPAEAPSFKVPGPQIASNVAPSQAVEAAPEESTPAAVQQPVKLAPTSLAEEFNFPTLDAVSHNDVELNLTVPQHPFYEPEREELEEMENDDYEIEISMLMNGKRETK